MCICNHGMIYLFYNIVLLFCANCHTYCYFWIFFYHLIMVIKYIEQFYLSIRSILVVLLILRQRIFCEKLNQQVCNESIYDDYDDIVMCTFIKA